MKTKSDKPAFSSPLNVDTPRRSRAASLMMASSDAGDSAPAVHNEPTLAGPDAAGALFDRHDAWDFQDPSTGEVQEAFVMKPPDANAMPVISSSRRRVTFEERLPGSGAAGEHYAEMPVSDIRLPGSGGQSVVEQFEGGADPGGAGARRSGVDAVLGAARKEPKNLRPLVTWANDVTPGLIEGDETDRGPLGDRTARDSFIDGGAHSKRSRHRFQPPSGVGDLQSATATSGHVNETNSTARMLPVASRVPELRETGAHVSGDDGRATRAIVSHSPSATAATTSVVSTLKSPATMKAGDAVPTSGMRADRSKFTLAMMTRNAGGAVLASARRGDETKRPSPALQRFSHAVVDGITPSRSDGLVGAAPTTSRHAHDAGVLSTAPVRYDAEASGVSLVSNRAIGGAPTTRKRADFGSHTVSARSWRGGVAGAPISATGRVDADDATSDTVTSRRADRTGARQPETQWGRHIPVATQRASIPEDPSDRGGRRLLPPVYVPPRATRVVQDGARAIGSVVDSAGWTGNKEPGDGAVDREPLGGGSWATGAVNLQAGSAPPLGRADPGTAPVNSTTRDRGIGNNDTDAVRVGTRDNGATGWRLDSRAAITASAGALGAFGFEQNGANETGSMLRTDKLRQADTVASMRWGSASHDLSGRVITHGDRLAASSEYGDRSEDSDDDQEVPFPVMSSRLPAGFAETVFGSGRVPKTDASDRDDVAREANDLTYTPLSRTALETSARHAVSAPAMRDPGSDFSRYSTVF